MPTLPLQSTLWQHNGGEQPYPSHCERFSDAQQAWEYIESLHGDNITYNLLYVPGEIFCLPRRKQGSYTPAEWTGGFGWYEMCGGMVCFNREQYDSLNEVQIAEEFVNTRV